MNKKGTMAQYMAEFFGTFFFVTIGLGSVAVMVLDMSDIDYPFMAVCWGGGITLAIYMVGSVSGAHMNPAVTVATALFGGFDRRKVFGYIVAQIIGAFCAAAVIYLVFSARIDAYEAANGWVRGTSGGTGAMGIFVTGAAGGISMWKTFIVEMIDTAALVLTVFAVTDGGNGSAPKSGIGAIAIGASVTFCGIALGPATGFAMNPARDLGPRIFITLAGWGGTAWGENLYGLVVPIFATLSGGILAGAVYTNIIKKQFDLV